MDKFLKQEEVCGLFQEVCRKGSILTLTTHNMEVTKRKLYDGFSSSSIYPYKVEVMEPTLESLFMEVVN